MTEQQKPEEWLPVCRQDFCAACGDCLACYSEDTCYRSADGKHVWVRDTSKGNGRC